MNMKGSLIGALLLLLSSGSWAMSPRIINGDFNIRDLIGNAPLNLRPPSTSTNDILAQDDIPGQPLNPDDFRSGFSLADEVLDDSVDDPITKAGLFEGDIDNVTHDDYLRILDSAVGNITVSNRNAIRDVYRKWPNAVVPYVISSVFNTKERAVIAKAFDEYRAKTCIRFIPRTNERAYVHIMKGNGCSSSVGRTGGVQTISLGNGCVYKGIVIHELMHAIGFWHEQSRYDRDDHVTIMWQNILESMTFNFLKYDLNKIDHLNAPYDTCSIMHYGKTAFSKDYRSPTIVQRYPSSCQLGQRKGFSDVDLMKINSLYTCNTSPTTVKPTILKPSSKCTDSNKFCPTWAKQGECEKNPSWMLKYCQISCKECGNQCVDHNPYCEKWAAKGECQQNEDYMDLFCLKSCGKCNGKCQDDNKDCGVWMDKGYCKKGSFVNYMKLRCKKSCNFC